MVSCVIGRSVFQAKNVGDIDQPNGAILIVFMMYAPKGLFAFLAEKFGRAKHG